MEIWTQLLQSTLGYLQAHFGLSEALGIIVLTLIARVAMMPISLTCAYRMQMNKRTIERIKPLLEALRERHKDNPSELAKQTMAIYRENGVTFFDKLTLLNIGSQGIFGLGIFRSLKRMVFSSRFLWISSLAKPDYLLTALVAALMLLGMMLMPGASTNTSALVMLAVPIILSIVAIAALPSALGVYWATSNSVTIVQTLALRGLLKRRARMAA
jgi:YidC/Oxa1 family membrane protein insertase